MELLERFRHPSREYSLMPFWFWNDRLRAEEILRQMADFQDHGVEGFVLHPRVGLPRDQGWMSPGLLGMMRIALEEARRRRMVVWMYDEGMYPSGSASGQVAASNPRYRCRGLVCQELDEGQEPQVEEGWNVLAVVRRKSNGRRIAVIDRPLDAVIRGLHFLEEDPPRDPGPDDPRSPGQPRRLPPEEEPPATDLLNPEAVACFVRLVYERYYQEFREFFGDPIVGFFTDEPALLGRLRHPRTGVVPGTSDILEHVHRHLGYDFTPYLPALWYDDEPEAPRRRADWQRAVQARLSETYYRQLYSWCQEHGVLLTGHPDRPTDLAHQRFLHIPGQDIVWRQILPGTASALEGPESTQAKCTSSAMVHLGRQRNANEFCGAYGPSLTFQQMKWLADWLMVRGVNLLIPHAFYYSVRGPRVDERPPDVGPNSPWWNRFREFADYCRRLCALSATGRHICRVAILAGGFELPWRAAKVLFENQIDFNYLEDRHLWEDARLEPEGLRIGPMCYQVLVLEQIEGLNERVWEPLEAVRRAGRLVEYTGDEAAFLREVEERIERDIRVEPRQKALRYRLVEVEGWRVYLIHNEEEQPVQCRLRLRGTRQGWWVDTWRWQGREWTESEPVRLEGYQTALLVVKP